MADILDLMICRIPGLKAGERIELERKFNSEDDFSALSMKDLEKLLGRSLTGSTWEMIGRAHV